MEIKSTWEYSLKTEAERLLHTAHQIAVGFYKVNNFIVLPYGSKYANSSTVSFPDLDYFKIPRFWDKAKKVDVRQIPIKTDAKTVSLVEELLTKEHLPEPQFREVQKTWTKAQNEVIKEIEKILPQKKGVIKSITIYPSVIGTNTSFNQLTTNNPNIFIYLRHDQDIYAITEAILTSLTRGDVYTKLDGIWSESEIIVDWLVTFSSIARVLNRYQKHSTFSPTLKQIRVKQSADLQAQSRAYYQKLGVLFENQMFNLHGNEPFVAGASLQNLTIREKEILTLLIKKGNQLTTIDEIANILFKSDDDFSLQAIAKTIQRLRDKLETNGVSGSFIQTKRGEGYLLLN